MDKAIIVAEAVAPSRPDDGVIEAEFADVIDPAYIEAHIAYLKEQDRLPDR